MRTKILLLLIIALLLSGCTTYKNEEDKKQSRNKSFAKYTVVVEFDSCEYIRYYGEGVAHKGNCKFCKERRKK